MTSSNQNEIVMHADGSAEIGTNAIISSEGIRRCCAPEVDMDKKDAVIKSVEDLIKGLGYSSFAICGQDDFDHKCIAGQSTFTIHVQGGLCKGLEYPYSLLQYREENKWLIKCANIYFRIYNNIIPYNKNDCYISNWVANGLGTMREGSCDKMYNVFTVPRSSGVPCEAIVENAKGLKFHNKTKNEDSSENLELYMLCSFNMDGSPLDMRSLYGLANKVVPINNILEQNPSFDTLKIKFELFTDTELEDCKIYKTKQSVMCYFNSLHHKWFEDTCIPVLKKITGINIEVYEITRGSSLSTDSEERWAVENIVYRQERTI